MRKPRPTKFIQGRRIYTIADVLWLHYGGRPWVYLRGRITHTSWILNMAVCVVNNFAQGGHLMEALPNPSYKEKKHGSDIPF